MISSSEGRVYERDTDAAFLRLFRGSSNFAKSFARAVTGRSVDGAAQVEGQRRHVGSTGSIDISIRYPCGLLVLIENKIDAGYSVTQDGHGQPQRYQRTVATYRERGVEVYSVLLAPENYIKSSRLADMFDRCVTYESLREEISASDAALIEAAIRQAEAPYEPIPNTGAISFFASIRKLVTEHYPDIFMKRDPNPSGIRPADSRTVYFDTARSLHSHPAIRRPRMSLQCWDSGAPSASVKIMMDGLAHLAKHLPVPGDLADIGGYLRPAGRSLGIVIDTPRLNTQRPFQDQWDDIVEALEAAIRLQGWWNNNSLLLAKWQTLEST
jgi:hypothetical protein